MLRFISYDIVFQEIPGEVTLALNLTGCPNRCSGCHSPHLWENIGEELNEGILAILLQKYGSAITCVCFMGGDAEPAEVERLAVYIRTKTNDRLKIGWYSGKPAFAKGCALQNFHYLKLGAYIDRLGGLTSHTTNQRFYAIEDGKMVDKTGLFHKKDLRG